MTHNPLHPGEMIRKMCLEPLELPVMKTAEALGVTRKTLSQLVNGKSGVSPEMSIRLSKAFDTTPEFWLGLQMSYGLWQAKERAGKIKMKRLAV